MSNNDVLYCTVMNLISGRRKVDAGFSGLRLDLGFGGVGLHEQEKRVKHVQTSTARRRTSPMTKISQGTPTFLESSAFKGNKNAFSSNERSPLRSWLTNAGSNLLTAGAQ